MTRLIVPFYDRPRWERAQERGRLAAMARAKADFVKQQTALSEMDNAQLREAGIKPPQSIYRDLEGRE